MCGIAGWVTARPPPAAEAVLRRMVARLAHRGPDDTGHALLPAAGDGPDVALGSCRLAIIDLAGGRQPMRDAGVTLVYNGELYNFQALRADLERRGRRFVGRSDTEVVLRAYQEWGEACVDRFHGMFAFAIWDAPRACLVLARDPFGEKPLFLCPRPGGLLFASEIKALLAFPGVPAALDYGAMAEYLVYRYAPGPATLFAGIEKLPAGTVAVWAEGRLRARRYYDPPDGAPPVSAGRPRDAVAAFRARLDAAVTARLVSDVPFGAFLSGGIDSSAIVALMARALGRPVETFTAGFEEEGYSELGFARLTADRFGTRHHELVVPRSRLLEELPALVRFRDAPVSDPSDVVLYLLAREARRTVTMVLTGEGSDEILGGYPKHAWERYAPVYQTVPAPLRHRLIEPLVRTLPYGFRRVKIAAATLGLERADERFARWFGALSRDERDRLLVPTRVPIAAPGGRPAPVENPPGTSALRRLLYFDQTSWLPDNQLERGDRLTMAASLEARLPFLDLDLVAFVSSLADRYRVRGHRTKWILRQAMTRLLPPPILRRPKVGLRVPVNEWFRREMAGYLQEHLTGSLSLTRDYYRPEALRRVLAEHLQGLQNHEKLLWTLLNLELWHRAYLAEPAEAAPGAEPTGAGCASRMAAGGRVL